MAESTRIRQWAGRGAEATEQPAGVPGQPGTAAPTPEPQGAAPPIPSRPAPAPIAGAPTTGAVGGLDAPPAPVAPPGPQPLRPVHWHSSAVGSVRRVGRRAAFPAGVYLTSRLLLLAVAVALAVAGHRALGTELSVFDGRWFLRLAAFGYPTHVVHVQSTLGFFPLYPLTFSAVAWICSCSQLVAGLLVSFVGGLIATILVQRIAETYGNAAVARRAVVAFCLFPGSVVFSLVYSESLLIPLAAGCLLALSRRRWVLAGALAGCASAVEPIGVVIVAVCAVASWTQVHRSGWHDQGARRSLAAPALSVSGIGAFAAYLWVRTGTPFATVDAQYYGWHQHLNPVAVLGRAVARLGSTTTVAGHAAVVSASAHAATGASGFNFNLVNGLGGAVFLAAGLVLLVRARRRLPPGALVWTAGIALLTFWSIKTPPNARMIMSAFPAVTIFADRLAGKSYYAFVVAEAVLLVAMTGLTITGRMTP